MFFGLCASRKLRRRSPKSREKKILKSQRVAAVELSAPTASRLALSRRKSFDFARPSGIEHDRESNAQHEIQRDVCVVPRGVFAQSTPVIFSPTTTDSSLPMHVFLQRSPIGLWHWPTTRLSRSCPRPGALSRRLSALDRRHRWEKRQRLFHPGAADSWARMAHSTRPHPPLADRRKFPGSRVSW